jgi:hypothetical protein
LTDDPFNLTEFDYIAGGLAGFCMSGVTKEQLWGILNMVENAYDLDTAIEAQENLLLCVEKYYGRDRHDY